MDLNVKGKREKLPKDNKGNIEERVHDLGIGKDFFNWTQKVLPLQEKIDTPYLIKIENFCL